MRVLYKWLVIASVLKAAVFAAVNGGQTARPAKTVKGVAASRCEQNNRRYQFNPPIDQDQRGPDSARTDLMRSLSAGDVAAACWLIAGGANVNAADRDGVTALLIAAGMGQAGVVRALLSAGADANAADTGGETPL